MLTLLMTRNNVRITEAFSKVGIKTVSSDFRKQEKKLRITTFISDFAKIKPNLFWFLKDEWLKPTTLKRLKKASPKTKFLMLYGDQRGMVPEFIADRAPFLDMLLVNNADPAQVTMYRKVGINHVKPYYPNYYPTELSDTAPTIAITFGGNNFRAGKFPLGTLRLKTVLAIRKLYDAEIYGNGWPIPAKKYVSDRTKYNNILRNSKITLGINHYDVIRYYDRRLFDCMYVGRLHLVYYIPGMEKDFTNHEHLVWFKSVPECVKLAKYYLQHDKKREQIGKAGLAKLVNKYSIEAKTKRFAKYVSVLF